MPRKSADILYLTPIDVDYYPIKITGKTDLLIKTRINVASPDPANPHVTAASALYWLTDKPEITDKTSFNTAIAAKPMLGYPVQAIKNTALDYIRKANMKTPTLSQFNTAFQLESPLGTKYNQGTGFLTAIDYESIMPVESPDGKRFVAQIHNWSMTVMLAHIRQSNIKLDKIVKTINKAGKNGIGAYAPCAYLTPEGTFGTFTAERVDKI